MKTYGDWFSGFGGMTIGAKDAGFTPVFACEYDAEIAAVYADNLGDHVTVADLLTLDNGISHPRFPRTTNERKRRQQDAQGDWFRRVLARGAKHSEFKFATPRFHHVDWKHDSPPCPNFSVAKAGAQEGLREIALAVKCCEYLMYSRPDFYSLENVYGYRKSESFGLILKTLDGLGYDRSHWHLNAADYGVPQTRKRLILMARADGRKPQKPTATRQKEAQRNSGFVGSLFGDSFELPQWIGWHEAIEDLAHSLPDSEFADWQKERLPMGVKTLLVNGMPNDNGRTVTNLPANEPAFTMTASGYKRPLRALLVNDTNSNGVTTRESGQPAPVVTASLHSKTAVPKALLVGDQRSHGGEKVVQRKENEPCFVVDTRLASKNRAFLAPIQGEATNGFGVDEPAQTIAANHGAAKYRAAINGRVVQMTVRALSRFQSFPDWYRFPKANDAAQKRMWEGYRVWGERPLVLDKWQREHVETSRSLSCKGIGNAVPPKLAAAIGKNWGA